jgi:hypothetical protein
MIVFKYFCQDNHYIKIRGDLELIYDLILIDTQISIVF